MNHLHQTAWKVTDDPMQNTIIKIIIKIILIIIVIIILPMIKFHRILLYFSNSWDLNVEVNVTLGLTASKRATPVY